MEKGFTDLFTQTEVKKNNSPISEMTKEKKKQKAYKREGCNKINLFLESKLDRLIGSYATHFSRSRDNKEGRERITKNTVLRAMIKAYLSCVRTDNINFDNCMSEEDVRKEFIRALIEKDNIVNRKTKKRPH